VVGARPDSCESVLEQKVGSTIINIRRQA
jgi:hypothetical protein